MHTNGLDNEYVEPNDVTCRLLYVPVDFKSQSTKYIVIHISDINIFIQDFPVTNLCGVCSRIYHDLTFTK